MFSTWGLTITSPWPGWAATMLRTDRVCSSSWIFAFGQRAAQVALILPVAAQAVGVGVAGALVGALGVEAFEGALEQVVVGQHGAEEEHRLVALDEEGGEVVDVVVVEEVGVVLHVQPQEAGLGKAGGQGFEAGAVVAAGAAPGGAQAGDEEFGLGGAHGVSSGAGPRAAQRIHWPQALRGPRRLVPCQGPSWQSPRSLSSS
jgi:hypothetical protein